MFKVGNCHDARSRSYSACGNSTNTGFFCGCSHARTLRITSGVIAVHPAVALVGDFHR